VPLQPLEPFEFYGETKKTIMLLILIKGLVFSKQRGCAWSLSLNFIKKQKKTIIAPFSPKKED